ncbi:hypothetical protein DFH28DRAFT_851785, partial [Melampsora americana]
AFSWSYIENSLLREAFYYCYQEGKLFGKKWMANQAKSIYLSLQQTVLKELSSILCKFTLVHNMWISEVNSY